MSKAPLRQEVYVDTRDLESWLQYLVQVHDGLRVIQDEHGIKTVPGRSALVIVIDGVRMYLKQAE